jgi:biotin carboxyl carrier protein
MTQVGTTPLARCALAVAALAAALSGCASDPRHTSEAAAAIAEDAAPIAEAAAPAPEAASDPAATPAGQAAAKPATPKVDAHSGDASTASPQHPLAMQVGSTVAFLFERPDAGSAPVAQVREGSAVKEGKRCGTIANWFSSPEI